MKTNLIITFYVKPTELEAFEKMLAEVKQNLPKVPGCEKVDIYKHQDQKNVFTLVEQWSTREAHGKHVENMLSSGAWEKIETQLLQSPVSGYFSVLE